MKVEEKQEELELISEVEYQILEQILMEFDCGCWFLKEFMNCNKIFEMIEILGVIYWLEKVVIYQCKVFNFDKIWFDIVDMYEVIECIKVEIVNIKDEGDVSNCFVDVFYEFDVIVM